MDTTSDSPDNRDTDLRQRRSTMGIQKILSLALIPIVLIITALLFALNIPGVYEPPYLLLILNTVFIGISSIVIAYITYRVFTKSGSVSVFLMGSGLLIFGLGSIVAGWLLPVTGDPNTNVTIHNTCACAGSVIILAGAVISTYDPRLVRNSRRAWIGAATYTGILVFVALFSLAAMQGLIPLFFIQGVGPTVLRQVILENTVMFFAIASVLVMFTYYRRRSDFFFWFSISLALISIGLGTVLFIQSVGSLAGWAGRLAQYLGFIYALCAVLIARRAATAKGLPLEEVIAGFFVDAEQSYKQLVETAADAIVTFDDNDRILLWNVAAERMFGYTRDEAVGSSFPELVIDDRYIAIIKNEDEEIPVGGQHTRVPKSIEISGKHKDGTLLPVELTISRRWQNGRLIRTGILRDLTERKRFEEDLRAANEGLETRVQERTAEIERKTESLRRTHEELSASYQQLVAAEEQLKVQYAELLEKESRIGESGKQFRLTFTKAPIGAAIVSLDFRFMQVNEAFCRITGYTAEELTALTFPYITHPDDLATDVKQAQQLAAGEIDRYVMEKRYIRKDGSIVWVQLSAGLVKDADGRPLYYLPMIEDITERKRAEDLLRESEEKYRILAEAILDPIFVISHDDTILYVNTRAAQLLNSTPEQILKKPRKSQFPPDIADEQGRALQTVFNTGKPLRKAARVLYGDREFWQDNSLVPLKDENGNVSAILGIAHDITERKQAEAQLRQFAEELERKVADRTAQLDASLKEKEMLLKEIHHRVKNNLQIVASLLNLQSRQITDPAMLAMFRESQNRVRAMALVHERLYRSEDISSINLLDYVRFMGTNLFKFYGITPATARLEVGISDIRMDINRAIPLGLLINELLSNSLKHAFPAGRKGTITVTGEKADGTIRIIVQDDGAGIPESLDWKNTSSLGLQLVNSLTDQLEGTIELDRTAGTKFVIRIPVAQDVK